MEMKYTQGEQYIEDLNLYNKIKITMFRKIIKVGYLVEKNWFLELINYGEMLINTQGFD